MCALLILLLPGRWYSTITGNWNAEIILGSQYFDVYFALKPLGLLDKNVR